MPAGVGRSFRQAASVALLLAVGCAKPNHVTGTVTFKGEPLPAGQLTFVCDGGERPIIVSGISESGGYEVKNPPAGRVRVAVETFPQVPIPSGTNSLTGREYAADWVDTGPYVPIPRRYASPNTSGLEYTITPGEQTIDIVLEK